KFWSIGLRRLFMEYLWQKKGRCGFSWNCSMSLLGMVPRRLLNMPTNLWSRPLPKSTIASCALSLIRAIDSCSENLGKLLEGLKVFLSGGLIGRFFRLL